LRSQARDERVSLRRPAWGRQEGDDRGTGMTYWIVAVALIVFGFITGFSIGQPFLLVGLVMLGLGPVRNRPLAFWPPLLGVIAFNVVYWAIAPFSCTAGFGLDSSGAGTATSTVCTSLLGLRYGGEGIVNPSLLPAIAVGLAAGVLVGVLTFVVLRRRRGTSASTATPQIGQ
jgi:hypothetical protein